MKLNTEVPWKLHKASFSMESWEKGEILPGF